VEPCVPWAYDEVARSAETTAAEADSEVAEDDAADAAAAQDAADTAEDDATASDGAAAEPAEPEPEPEVEDPEPQPEPAEDLTPVVFNDDFSESIQPIFTEKCAQCHAPDGPGASHWVLESAQDVVDTHLLISGVVESGYMPPWPASELSVDFHQDRSLEADQIAAILDWSAAGAPLDIDPTSPMPPPAGVIGLKTADKEVRAPAPYAGDPNVTDDYRCQIYDPGLENGGWLKGYEFLPDQLDVVHHAIGYLLPGELMAEAQARDGEDGLPGWTCYGSSGIGGASLIGANGVFLGWAPGQDASVFPEGAGLRFDPGDFMVLQIHYHYEGEAPLDDSAIAVDFASDDEIAAAGGELDRIEIAELIAPVEIPCASWENGPLCERSAAVADALARFGSDAPNADLFTRICGYSPGDFAHMTNGVASADCTIPAGLVGATGEIVSVLGHMHEIGDWFRMTLNPGQDDELVLLDIPDWDFDWQYNYEPVDTITIEADDMIMVECGWDRARRDPSLPPAYILWADGTNDEMCFATISLR